MTYVDPVGTGTYYDPTTGLPKKKPASHPLISDTFGGAASGPATVADTQTPASGVGGGTGGQSTALPSIDEILGQDPMYQTIVSQLNGQSVADLAQLKAARQRAIILGGYSDISGFAPYGGMIGPGFTNDITGSVLQQAQAATDSGVSTKARIDAANTDAIRQIRNSLISRGMLHSGEYAFLDKNQQTAYTNAQFDALQKMVDYLAGGYQNEVNAERARQAQLLAAQQQAMMSYIAGHPYAPPTTPSDPTTSAPVDPTVADVQAGVPLWNAQQAAAAKAKQQYGYWTGGL